MSTESGIIRGGTKDHRCHKPDPINRKHHDEQEARSHQVALRVIESETAILEWRLIPWLKRLRVPMPGRASDWGRHHHCYEDCFEYTNGTVWRCKECGLEYTMRDGYWRGDQAPARSRVRYSQSDDSTGAAITGFVIGAVL